MDIRNIISVDFEKKVRRNLHEASLSRPGIQRTENRIFPLPYFDFLIKQKSLEGIIQILQGAHFDSPQNRQRYSYYSGFTPRQWCMILEEEVKNAKPFSDN